MRCLFESAPALDAELGSLVFTGAEDDPETLETLSRLGFKDAPAAAETIRGWHFGRRPAVRTARAREVLTELVPGLVQAFAELRRSGHGARRFRRRARPHAGGGRTVLALEIQSAPLRTLRRHSRRRAASCAHGDQPSAYSRCDDRSAHPRIPHRRERLRGARRATLLERSQHLEEFLDAAARFRQGGEFSDRPQAALRRAPARRGGTRLFGPGGQHRQGGADLHRTRLRPRAWPRAGRPRDRAWPRQARLARDDGRLRPRSHAHL